ncbi:MAG: ornithine carbamoyltransferase [Myxococcales bacterium]|nr:ornithine carbamoyltransferase [Myxococcales bacterium]
MTTVKHLISLMDWTPEQVLVLLDLAQEIKAHPEEFSTALEGKSLGMIFEKSSTRTRVSFEVGMTQLGGHALFLTSQATQMGRGEPVRDTASVLSRYVDGIMARTFSHEWVVELARYSHVPVINGLTDYLHPCQILADFQTVREHIGHLKGLELCYLGDGNNVAHSLINGAAKVGANIRVGCPEGYLPDAKLVERARREPTAGSILVTTNPVEAIAGAEVVYTDVWASMGQEAEQKAREAVFAPFQVNGALWKQTAKGAVFMHCLPAHRGEEVSAEICDGTMSVIYDQAENRLHAQKALLVTLM